MRERGHVQYDGNCSQLQVQLDTLHHFASLPEVSSILEIGFNAGHSSLVFLNAAPRASVVSFDLNYYNVTLCGKEFIDTTYPGRHLLILGDSRHTVPSFIHQNPGRKFDIIFIDGGHEYECAIADLLNCKQLAHERTILIMDDVVYEPHLSAQWTIGPTQAWRECIANGVVSETNYTLLEQFRGQVVGRYL